MLCFTALKSLVLKTLSWTIDFATLCNCLAWITTKLAKKLILIIVAVFSGWAKGMIGHLIAIVF